MNLNGLWRPKKEDLILKKSNRTLWLSFCFLLSLPMWSWAGGKPLSLQHFKDCSSCPEMVTLPKGTYSMGAVDPDANSDERVVHPVTIKDKFAVSRYEVTFAQWDACVKAKGCDGYAPSDAGWGRGKHPVVNVSYHDAVNYAGWLSKVTGKSYRLLSEAEWEYAARAGTSTRYYSGPCFYATQANISSTAQQFTRPGCRPEPLTDLEKTLDVGKYKPNPFGLYDMYGNVAEWVADCYHASYEGAPADGSPWRTGCDRRNPLQVVRGGNFGSIAAKSSSASRAYFDPESRGNAVGFRVAASL